MEFMLASGNAHKANEIAELFTNSSIQVEHAPEKIAVEENGECFMENAHLKAKAYFTKFNCPVMADDSGLVVESLPDELGIHSARFGGEGLSDRDRCKRLLEKLEGVENRKAYFVCQLFFLINKGEEYFFEGRLRGVIAREMTGDQGFGYDSVFRPVGLDGKSLADAPEWKKAHSHRFVACQMAKSFFSEMDCQKGRQNV